ncbi:4Fe-4S binding protein [Candidatus Woesearchaeota archaeon]|nr:4Fe-4S binding protein [Candidatus Woesearchaeota archaeon]
MGHVTSKSYKELQRRLDWHAQGAPESETLYKILEILFTKKEADLVTKLPIRFFTVEDAAERWNKTKKETKNILDNLARKGILLDLKKGETQAYVLAPTMAGFFEFSLMRTDGKFDRKVLSELFHQYINEEDDFARRLFALETPIGRVYVHEDTVKKYKSIILDYERASHIIKTATCITVSTCYCRHKMSHKGKACDNPQDTCLTFNKTAESLARHGIAKEISKEEAMKILHNCIDLGLVQIGDNIQEEVNWMCNCCGCCCEGLLAYKRLGYKLNCHSNFLSAVNHEKCVKCKICINKCPVDAIKIENDQIFVDLNLCIGCGVCSRFCPSKAISMKRREEINFVPKDTFERLILNAIEEGKLQNYIFDNYELWTNEMLRNFLGIMASLTPTKLLLAQKQLRSTFIQAAKMTRFYDLYNKICYEGKGQDYSHPELD